MSSTGSRRRGAPWWVASAAVAVGLLVLVVALLRPTPEAPSLDEPVGDVPGESPSGPDADGSGSEGRGPSGSGGAEADEAAAPLGPSRPERIEIPAIDVESEIIDLGLADDGTLAVPQPGPDLDKAAWFENSPTPGQPGPSIVEGHVSTAENGPSIFFDLAELSLGDRIRVDRADGTTVVFEVDAMREFAKDRFPTELIYGGELGTPTLRLITCSDFDPDVGTHTGNLIVFSRLVRVERG